ncbi:DUF4342 domain-containing protein [archaeon]|nr:DUF4342 domain-containing protein [archaeon]
MNCKKCEAENPEDAVFCNQCGASFKESKYEEITVKTENLVAKVKELVEEGNVRKLIVENDEGNTILDIPMTFAAIGTVFFPYMAALGAVAAIATHAKIKIERKE